MPNDKSLLHNLSVSMIKNDDAEKRRKELEKERDYSLLESLIKKEERIYSWKLLKKQIFYYFEEFHSYQKQKLEEKINNNKEKWDLITKQKKKAIRKNK